MICTVHYKKDKNISNKNRILPKRIKAKFAERKRKRQSTDFKSFLKRRTYLADTGCNETTASSGKAKVQPANDLDLRLTFFFSSEKWWSNHLPSASWKHVVGFKSDNICESSWKLWKSIQAQRVIISHAAKTAMYIYSFKSFDIFRMSTLGTMPGTKVT